MLNSAGAGELGQVWRTRAPLHTPWFAWQLGQMESGCACWSLGMERFTLLLCLFKVF